MACAGSTGGGDARAADPARRRGFAEMPMAAGRDHRGRGRPRRHDRRAHDAEAASDRAETCWREIGAILRLAPEDIDRDRAARRLGMDSLMAMELRCGDAEPLGIELPLPVDRAGLTVSELSTRIVAKLRGGTPAAGAEDSRRGEAAQLIAKHVEADLEADAAVLVREAVRTGPRPPQGAGMSCDEQGTPVGRRAAVADLRGARQGPGRGAAERRSRGATTPPSRPCRLQEVADAARRGRPVRDRQPVLPRP